MGTESRSHAIRDQLYSVLRLVAQTEPGLVNQLVTDALVAFVSREEKSPPKPVAEETERPVDYQIRLSSILSASSALPADTDLEVRKKILTNLIALAHHKRICKYLRHAHPFNIYRYAAAGSSRLLWIEICQRANVDPRELVESRLDDLLKIAFDATNSSVRSGFIRMIEVR